MCVNLIDIVWVEKARQMQYLSIFRKPTNRQNWQTVAWGARAQIAGVQLLVRCWPPRECIWVCALLYCTLLYTWLNEIQIMERQMIQSQIQVYMTSKTWVEHKRERGYFLKCHSVLLRLPSLKDIFMKESERKTNNIKCSNYNYRVCTVQDYW